jgi:hypothetical protein
MPPTAFASVPQYRQRAALGSFIFGGFGFFVRWNERDPGATARPFSIQSLASALLTRTQSPGYILSFPYRVSIACIDLS